MPARVRWCERLPLVSCRMQKEVVSFGAFLHLWVQITYRSSLWHWIKLLYSIADVIKAKREKMLQLYDIIHQLCNELRNVTTLFISCLLMDSLTSHLLPWWCISWCELLSFEGSCQRDVSLKLYDTSNLFFPKLLYCIRTFCTTKKRSTSGWEAC